MTRIETKFNALGNLRTWLLSDPIEWQEVKRIAHQKNPWFTQMEIDRATQAICQDLISEQALNHIIEKYDLNGSPRTKKTGLILAGNIPMVGWHDIQCVYLSGHPGLIKYSSKDDVLIPFLLKKLSRWDPELTDQIHSVERLHGMDAVIATGSNNTGRYFQEYFKNYPHIIRGHRNSVAILDGTETDNELALIGEDILSFYGLGCRNVTKLYLPSAYDIPNFLKILEEQFSYVKDHNKYINNLEYNYAIWLLNKEEFLASSVLLMKKNDSLLARIASVNYSSYDDRDQLVQELSSRKDQIQCIVTKKEIPGMNTIWPGKAQHPAWNDYADDLDTMEFLMNLE